VLLVAVVVAIIVSVVVTTAVPAMVVAELAAIAIPVAFIEALAIVTRRHPVYARVSWTGPVSLVPLIVVAHRVPVARYPGIAGAGTSRLHSQYTDRWRRADSHSDGKLGESCSRGQQRHHYNQFGFHNLFPHYSRGADVQFGHVAGHARAFWINRKAGWLATRIDRIRSHDSARSEPRPAIESVRLSIAAKYGF
jgi:hypothetical protein